MKSGSLLITIFERIINFGPWEKVTFESSLVLFAAVVVGQYRVCRDCASGTYSRQQDDCNGGRMYHHFESIVAHWISAHPFVEALNSR